MDGTLVDTTPLWFAAESALVHLFGGSWSEAESVALMGRSLAVVTGTLPNRGVDLTPQQIVAWQTNYVLDRLVDAVPWRPGALHLLRELRDADIRTALVTTATRRMADAVAAALPFQGFDIIVADDDVDRPKPDPQGYLRAAQLLGVDMTRCVVLEDSLTGVEAGIASGAATIGVSHRQQLPAGEWRLWDTLDGRGQADLAALVSP